MKRFFLIAIMFFSFSANAQLQSVHIEENYVVYKAREGNVDVDLYFHQDTDPSKVDINVLTQLINYTNAVIQGSLKSRRSFVPLSYTYKFKPNKKGKTAKDKHSLTMSYEGTNSYGGIVEDIAQLEFNAKLKETTGSVMLRM